MTRLAAATLVVFLAFSACAGGSGISGDLRNIGSVTVTFKVTPARAKVGQAVRLSFRLINNAGREEQLTFPTGRRYDFWVASSGREIWRWSKGRVFVQEVTKQTIGPQSGLSFSESWTPDRAGEYDVHGELAANRYGGEFSGELQVG